LRELLAMLIRSGDSAEIGTFAGADTCYEETYIRLLRVGWSDTQQRKACRERRANSKDSHLIASRHWHRPVASPSGGHNTGNKSLFRRSRDVDAQLKRVCRNIARQ
jgi:hypothetical protein